MKSTFLHQLNSDGEFVLKTDPYLKHSHVQIIGGPYTPSLTFFNFRLQNCDQHSWFSKKKLLTSMSPKAIFFRKKIKSQRLVSQYKIRRIDTLHSTYILCRILIKFCRYNSSSFDDDYWLNGRLGLTS